MNARDDLINYAASTRTITADGLTPYLERVEREAGAAALREAADWAETANPDRCADFSDGVDWLLGELRRIATKEN